MARATVAIIETGHYTTTSGKVVSLKSQIAEAVVGTVEYAPEARLVDPAPVARQTRFEVELEGTFEAAYRLRHRDPVVLNFASAKHPGGGFLTGAQAQEEALARDSALYACIRDRDMYQTNAQLKDALYSHAMIYSPGVPVLRSKDGSLLEEPWRTAVITAPAPNAGVVLSRDPERGEELATVLRERARRVLAVAHAHGHETLVLGAWGCGVFRNSPAQIAATFKELMTGPYAGVFGTVAFAVLDRADHKVITPFRREFGA